MGHSHSDVMSACTCQVSIHGYDPERKTRCIFCISPYCLSCVVAGDDYTSKAGTYIGVRSKFQRKILGIRNKLMAGESGTRLLSKHEFYSSPVQALYLFRYFHASYDYICIYIRSALCYPRIFASTSRRENTSRYHDEHAMLA